VAKPDAVQALSDWMVETALLASDYEPMFAEFCERLSGMGLPVIRISVSMTTLHPMMEAYSLLWTKQDGRAEIQGFAHGARDQEDWAQSPLKALIDSDKSYIHHDLTGPGSWSDFPLLRELAEKGITGYLAFVSPFSDERSEFTRQDGMLTSWSTDHPGGFSSDHVNTLRRLIPRFALIAKLANRERLAQNIVHAYLGEQVGRRVLNGQIKLGDGDSMRAVIWFSDLRNSTALAEQLPQQEFLYLLNDYFDSMAGAVMEHGGEVLRFIGDAALAMFPISEHDYSDQEARERALHAAAAAASRARIHNEKRSAAGQPPFQYGIGLHVGDIMYGNIGVPDRVEFTVIGPAANAAARLESLTKELGQPVLVSREFADGINHGWESMGEHAIRGSGQMMEVFTPTET
jgi:adenylate cyclase